MKNRDYYRNKAHTALDVHLAPKIEKAKAYIEDTTIDDITRANLGEWLRRIEEQRKNNDPQYPNTVKTFISFIK